jgi:hypothetical protein
MTLSLGKSCKNTMNPKELFYSFTDTLLSPLDFNIVYYAHFGHLPLIQVTRPIDFQEFMNIIKSGSTFSKRQRFQAIDGSCKGYIDEYDLLQCGSIRESVVILKRNLFRTDSILYSDFIYFYLLQISSDG